jgi:CxxC motif-containing protein
MIRNLTCIECPTGCHLTIELDDKGKVIKVTGNKCEKGEGYAIAEIEHPVRMLSSCILTEGLALKMVPVRLDLPIPRDRVFDAMEAIKKVRVHKPLKAGDAVVVNFLNLGVNLIATRAVGEKE